MSDDVITPDDNPRVAYAALATSYRRLQQRAWIAEERLSATQDALEEAQARAGAAEAQCAAMRRVCEQVEYVDGSDGPDEDYCPWCLAMEWMGAHDAACPREAALATDAGTALLAEVRRLREFAATIRAANVECDEPTDVWAWVQSALAGLDATEVTP